MKSAILMPYCPLPADHGGKRVMWECAELLRDMGPCRILSAATRPVGGGWTPVIRTDLEKKGYEVVLREDSVSRLSPRMALGYLWGLGFKGLGLDQAFGHANPYHRWAFPERWLRENTADVDLVVISYSFWSHLQTSCPKALLLLDLWSDTTWTHVRRETHDIADCDLVIVISKDEEKRLNQRGVLHTLWQPPGVPLWDVPMTDAVGLVGSGSAYNREGLQWLAAAQRAEGPRVRVYGGLARHADAECFDVVGRYEDDGQPYAECGIMLMTTTLGMGVQVKTVEALASGRVVIARRGAMRGIPPSDTAWIEVDTPEQMHAEAARLHKDAGAREAQGKLARTYYRRYLDSVRIREALKGRLQQLVTDTI